MNNSYRLNTMFYHCRSPMSNNCTGLKNFDGKQDFVKKNMFPRGLHLGLFRQDPLRELISPNLVCVCVCVCVCVYVRHAQKIAKLFFGAASERASVRSTQSKKQRSYFLACEARSQKNSEAIFQRAKHAVSFQIIKYIIQKNITTSWAPKYSVVVCLKNTPKRKNASKRKMQIKPTGGSRYFKKYNALWNALYYLCLY